jgi:TonB family protein
MSKEVVMKHARRSGWTWAVAGSCAVHAFVLGGLLSGGARPAAGSVADLVSVELTPDPEAPAAPMHVPAPEALPDPPLPSVDEAVAARPLDAPEGERDNAVARTLAPREGDGRTRAVPAPDDGADGGHVPTLATRRDRSTLESRIADAQSAAQPARLRTSRRSASPQADRRERETGVGDQVRTTEATRAPSAAAPEPPPAPAAAPDVAGPAPGSTVATRVEPPTTVHASETPEADRGVGPLAVEKGARSFDVETRGRAAENTTMRAASNAEHPGITDFSHAGAPAPTDSLQGRGPGSAPGAVARPTSGQAPSTYGARSPQELAADISERTREREYNRYRQAIHQRLDGALKFPRNLLVRLEQGEAVVTFAVRPDGSLASRPKLVKSSGFQEFDAEAVDVVLRAAPFGRRADKTDMTFMVPVTFENPVVR